MREDDVIFRVDAGATRGLSFGHLFRCHEISETLKTQNGVGITFMMRDFAEGVRAARGLGVNVMTMPPDAQPAMEAELLAGTPVRRIICDLPNAETVDIDSLRQAGKKVLVLDDFGNKALSADFVINGNLAKQHWQYEQPDGHCQKLYCGADYCVIGQRFFDRRSQWVSPAVDKVLITFGGSDPTGLTEKTVTALSGVSSLKTVTVLAGPGYHHNDSLHHVIEAASGPKFYLKENVPDIVSEFLEADVVIAAGGRTAYELAAMGKPAILIPSIDHEVSTAAALEELGASVNLGPWEPSSAMRLSQVLGLLNEEARRERMLKSGRAIFDGKALNRVCAVIDEMA